MLAHRVGKLRRHGIERCEDLSDVGRIDGEVPLVRNEQIPQQRGVPVEHLIPETDILRSVDRRLDALHAGDDQQPVHAVLLRAGCGDHIADDDARPLIAQRRELFAALLRAADRDRRDGKLHDLTELFRRMRDARVADDREIIVHALRETDRAQNVVGGGDDIADGDIHHVPAEHVGRAAAGDHRIDAAAVVERCFQSVVQIAALDDELHIVALRGDVRHEMIHSFVGGDAEKARLFHFQALRVSLLLRRNSKIKQKGS